MSNINQTVKNEMGLIKLPSRILLPIPLISFLVQKVCYRNRQKYSKLEAFEDLILRYNTAHANGVEMAVDYTQLSNSWGWSRPSVMEYIDKLLEFDVVEVKMLRRRKIVSLKSRLLSSDNQENLRCEQNSASLSPPPPSDEQFPSGEVSFA